MAMEAIAAVRAAEQTAAERKAEAAQRVGVMEADAEREGRAAVEKAAEKAAAELRDRMDTAKARGLAEGEAIQVETRQEMEQLRSRAEARMSAAANTIVERIVNG